MSKLSDIRAALSPLGLSVIETPEGEFRINYREGRKTVAVYATDVPEAIRMGHELVAEQNKTHPTTGADIDKCVRVCRILAEAWAKDFEGSRPVNIHPETMVSWIKDIREEAKDALGISRGTFKILDDPDCANPYEGSESVRIVVLHRKYADPSKGACGTDIESVAKWAAMNRDEWFSIPLWLYDHSGTVYRAGKDNPFECKWDSGCVGLIALKRSDFGRFPKQLEEAASEVARNYTLWANGECYGFVTSTGESAYGYVGREAAEAAARQSLGIKEAA